MRNQALAIIAVTLVAASSTAMEAPPSPYAGQQSRDIKALSPDDVGAMLEGKGMGLAKAAELNGYAGPAHVLELASQLELTAEQRRRTEALFASMSARAKSYGVALVEKERDLDSLFKTRSITPQRLASVLTEIGALQAKVRDVHLQAHLAQVEILTPEQNGRYATLRGYGAAGGIQHHKAH